MVKNQLQIHFLYLNSTDEPEWPLKMIRLERKIIRPKSVNELFVYSFGCAI